MSTTVSFKYNANGLRTRKIVNGVMTKYTLHGKNVVHMTRGSDNLHFFYDAQNKPAVVVYNGTAYAYVKNLQGDIIAILDSAGTAVVSYTYDAWGAPTGTTGTMAATLGVLNPFRYRSYVFDEETGLYYLRSRYYVASLCRFVNADVVLGQQNNIFVYCLNSPALYHDPDGKKEFDFFETLFDAVKDFANEYGNKPVEYYTFFLSTEDSGTTNYFYFTPFAGTETNVNMVDIDKIGSLSGYPIVADAHTHGRGIEGYYGMLPSEVDYLAIQNMKHTHYLITPNMNIYRFSNIEQFGNKYVTMTVVQSTDEEIAELYGDYDAVYVQLLKFYYPAAYQELIGQ